MTVSYLHYSGLQDVMNSWKMKYRTQSIKTTSINSFTVRRPRRHNRRRSWRY